MKHTFSEISFTMARRDSFVYVKSTGNGGYLAPACRPGMAHRTVHLDSVWVTPRKRSSGHGRLVLEDLFAFTDALHVDVILEVNPYDQRDPNPERLVKLYQSFGFKKLRGRREWPRVVMRREGK